MYVAQKKFHGSLGNTKIGKIANVNLLCGDDDLNGKVDVIGTCTNCCESCKKSCYGRKSYRYPSAIIAHADNTKYVREDLDGFFKDLQGWVAKIKPQYFRYHSHGEIINESYLIKMVETAKMFPDTLFYVYTKRYQMITEAKQNNQLTTSNLVILFSPPFSCTSMAEINAWDGANNPGKFPLFIYDNHTDAEISKIPHCPAVTAAGRKTGITCDNCQRCIKGLTTAVYAH